MKLDKIKYHLFFNILVVVFLPWDTIVGSVFIAISAFYSLFLIIQKKEFIEKVFNIKYFISISVLLMYFIGVFYSDNITYGISFVQTTIVLMFFPFMFEVVNYKNKDLKIIVLSFVFSYSLRVVYVLYSILKVFFISEFKANWYFQQIDQLGGFHTTYMSLYSLVVIILLLYLLNRGINKLYIGILVFHIFFIFILASRMALITLIVLFIVYNVYLFRINIKTRKYILILASISVVSASILSYNNHDLKYKFLQLRNINGLKYNKYDASSIASRIAKWESALNIFKKNKLIGTGTGDLPNDLLEEFYKIECLQCVVKKYNNPHNQYLDSLSRNGIIGLILLLTTMIYPLIISIKQRNIFHLMFLITFALMFTTECLLNREKGVQLFGFFYSFFFLLNAKNNEK